MGEETTSERGGPGERDLVDDVSIDIDLEPLGAAGALEPPEAPRRTVLGLGDLRDLPVRPPATRSMPELELELELDLSSIELTPATAPRAGGDEPAGRAAPDAVDISIDIPLELEDNELTVDRGAQHWGGEVGKGRAPTQDPAIEVSSVQVDDQLLSFEDATGELDVSDLAERRSVGVARPVSGPAPPPLPEVTDMQDPERLAESLLTEVDRGAPAGEGEADRLRRRVSALLDRATAEAEAGQLRTAVVAAELAVSQQPDSAVVQRALADRSDTLVRLHAGFLGDLNRIPELVVPMGELSPAELDHRTAFLLSRIDGTLSLDDLLDVCGMPRIEALRVLSRLVLRGILRISP